MKQAIAFSRSLITVPVSSTKATKESKMLAYTCAAEVARVGYVLDQPALDALARLNPNAQRVWTTEVVTLIKNKLGAGLKYKPFYINFPESVIEMSHFELFVNAIVHYWSNGTWEPAQELRTRGPFKEVVEMSGLRLATEEKFLNIFTELVSANQSLSARDKATVEWFVKTYGDKLTFPAKVPFKETLAQLATLGCNVPVSQETDVLRIALAMSGVDVAILPIPKSVIGKQRGAASTNQAERDTHKFKKFSRPERKYLLGLLESTKPEAEEMQVHCARWIRLGEILHVGEYRNKFPLSFEAFDRLRKQDPKVRTFASNIEYLMKHDFTAALDLLTKRPGEFARRFDSLLRDVGRSDQVIKTFAKVVNRVSSKVLCELYEHISHRVEDTTRSVIAKGSRNAAKLETLPALPAHIVGEAISVITLGMMNGMAGLGKMGKVYIDARLKNMGLMKGARTAGDSLMTIPRGSRIPFPANTKTLRAFVHWFDKDGYIDLDLSSRFLTADGHKVDHVSFTQLRFGSAVVHSGDIRHRRGACAEYIDINLSEIDSLCKGSLKSRYATLEVFNYNGHSLKSVDQCVVGFMSRERPQSGEIFEPLTVKNAMTPSSEGTSTLACVFDLVKREMIWADLDLGNTRYTESADINATLLAILRPPVLSIYKLLEMHVEARGGKLVASAEQADTVFDYDVLSAETDKLANLATW